MGKPTYISAEVEPKPLEPVQPLAPYLQILKTDFERAFREGNWTEMNRLLDSLAAIGEQEGHRELCLRAQSLQEVLGHRAGGRGVDAGEALTRHAQELSFHLSHLQWISN